MVKTVKIVNLKEFKEVHAQELKRETHMLPKDNIIAHMYDIHDIIRVVISKETEDFKFYTSLILVLLFVLDYLYAYFFLLLMIITF
jgi:hypothetical protein